MKQTTANFAKPLKWILIIGGFIGIMAAFILTMEKMSLLQDASYQPSCNLNPVLSCGSVIRTLQAEAFGFPNPLIGLVSYGVVVTVGMALLAGAAFKRWFWRGLQLGTLFGVGFVHWLAFESIYRINALCIYCLVVWIITIPMFWYTLLHNLREGHLPTPKALQGLVNFAQKHHLDILVTWYLLFVVAILTHFWYYWQTLL